MVILNDIYKGPYNVLANPPIILDTENPQNPWDSYVNWRQELNDSWAEYDEDFLPTPVMKIIDDIANAYEGKPGSYLSLAQDGIRFAFLFLPGGQSAAFAINKILGLIFPTHQPSLFDQIKDLVEQMIDQKFEQQEINSNINRLNGLITQLGQFSNSIQQALGKPMDFPVTHLSSTTNKLFDDTNIFDTNYDCSTDPNCSCSETPNRSSDASPCTPCPCRIKGVQDEFIATRKVILDILNNMKTSLDGVLTKEHATTYMQIFLPIYTKAATLLFGMYKSYIEFATKYNFEMGDNGNTMKYTNELRQYISTESSYVYNEFNKYLPDSKVLTKGDLNKYIQYSRTITLNALDTVSTWPLYNILEYPISTTLNPTRLVFNDIIGPVECKTNNQNSDSLSFSTLYDYTGNNLLNNDITNYFYKNTQLQSLSFQRYKSPKNNPIAQDIIVGVSANYSDGIQFKKEASWSPYKGYTLEWENDVLKDYPTLSIMNAVSLQDNGGFVAIDESWLLYNNLSSASCASQNNIVFPNQKIQSISTLTPNNTKKYSNYGNTDKLGLITTLIPNDTSPSIILNNPIGINTFSAEQATTTTGTRLVEYVNGAAALQLKQGQSAEYIINTSTILSGKYQVRFRAAMNDADNACHLSFTINNSTETVTLSKDTNPLKIVGKQGTYMISSPTSFQIPSTTKLSMSVLNTGDNDVILDRIEFIPAVINKDQIKIPPQDVYIPFKGHTPLWNSKDERIVTHAIFEQPVQRRYLRLYLKDKYVDLVPDDGIVTTPFDSIILYNSTEPSAVNIHFEGATLTLSPQNQKQFTTLEDLEKITNQVNQLFTSSSQTELAQTVTDYNIDQVALKVDALSDDVFGVEKKALRKLVNQAKQLSKARNVLVGGNFEKGHEWVLGREAKMVANHDLFKGDHLLLPPPTLYPSYAYQKINESKLQPNTRYTVSGFVAQSEQLEVIVSRYGKEVHDMLDVPYEEALPISSDEHPNCCQPAGCQCPSCNGDAPDSHFFNYSIDVGSLQSDVNLGIELGLRIAKFNGVAKISNLEIKEDRPLTDQEIKKVQRKEQKWKKAFDQEQAELAATLQPTLDQINALYQQEDWNGSLHPHVTYQHLSNVVLPTLSKQRHWFMEDRQGEHYNVTQQFQQALDRAFQQIEEQNLIHNGSFANGLTDWTVTGDAHVTIQDDDQVLELSHWDANVSQTIEITDFEDEKEYKLRVRGKGKGTVTVQHGEEELETMTFNTSSFTTQEQTFYFEGNIVDVQVQSENNAFLVDSVELIEVVEE
ncbi:delta endotoxin C-terminal domain-containing protein [Bacillus tropicus]|uniref:delta endotoxin C-terminal domain-containing protein n=1 Tax=Bacillus tropicus TaxID=2026188 RepID=UPI000B451D21|nr:delta endotoxin C-terminal domain-containing protein [Bacillus tropicus]AHK06512.1 delta-endotoxin CRY2627 [Bacillus thuringiensis]MED2996287.1 delta endotoxin C-terminal domain-containing protein [Bacillus tropicus]OTY57628.1 hypothetical protein BK748_13935 [Bacillus thuringiensis serovar graciosensis]